MPTLCAHVCRVGDSEAQAAQLSAVTREATAKALLITIKKLQVGGARSTSAGGR